MLLVVERSLRRPGGILGLFEALLELAVEKLALLALGAELLLEALLALGGLRPELVEGGAEVVDRPRGRRRLVRDDGLELGIQRELRLAARTLDRERRSGHGVKLAARPEGVKPCDNAADGRNRQRVFLVAESRQHLSGLPAPLLPPLLRLVGRMGCRSPRGHPPALHPQAARVTAAVGGTGRPRRHRDGLPRLRWRSGPSGRAVHRRRRRTDARRVAFLESRTLSRKPQDGGAVRARVRDRPEARSVAGALPQRRRLPA